MRKTLIFRVLAFCITVFFMSACSSEEMKPPVRPVPVMTAYAVKKPVPVRIKAIGTVEAYESISVRSQITGLITKVHFREGQDVKQGDVLLVLDNRTYIAALKQAEANVARDRAQAAKAREDLKRYALLLEKDYVAREQYDQVRADLASLEATVKADDAAVESARVMLQYCTITSPISGRTGRLQVDQGNIVKANDVEILTINRIQPVHVAFAVPEKDLSRVRKHTGESTLSVDAFISGEERPEKGELSFVDNAVDRTTGTITLKAVFDNAERRLVPGQFVDVVLVLAVVPDAVVVPGQGIDQGQAGPYVYIIGKDSKAEMRQVVTGEDISGETVILKGIQAGDEVVIDGQLRLTPGAQVSVKNRK